MRTLGIELTGGVTCLPLGFQNRESEARNSMNRGVRTLMLWKNGQTRLNFTGEVLGYIRALLLI